MNGLNLIGGIHFLPKGDLEGCQSGSKYSNINIEPILDIRDQQTIIVT